MHDATLPTMTTAQQIAKAFREDGQCFRTTPAEVVGTGLRACPVADDDGNVTLDEVCFASHGFKDWRDGFRAGDTYAWEFNDGSAIVVAGAAWDERANGCTAHCWAGVGCTCDKSDDHEGCPHESVLTADGRGAFCKLCGETAE